MIRARWQALILVATAFGVVAVAGWALTRDHHFSAYLVAFEFVPASKAESIPGSQMYPGEDALAVRFLSGLDLLHLAEVRQLQFRCAIDGGALDGIQLFGAVFPDLGSPSWQLEIATHAGELRQYIARVRLWPSEVMADRSTFYRHQFLAGALEQVRCQVVGVMMAPSFYYSSEMVVSGADVRTAVADALSK